MAEMRPNVVRKNNPMGANHVEDLETEAGAPSTGE
jgi:hypothetical protein